MHMEKKKTKNTPKKLNQSFNKRKQFTKRSPYNLGNHHYQTTCLSFFNIQIFTC